MNKVVMLTSPVKHTPPFPPHLVLSRNTGTVEAGPREVILISDLLDPSMVPPSSHLYLGLQGKKRSLPEPHQVC